MKQQYVTFLDYTTQQLYLPMDLEEWIEEDHICRLVHEVVETLDESLYLCAYEGGGRSSYHPKMMLKLVLFAYTQKVTSGRKMAEMCKSSIPMLWLCARQTPDFRTINRFRSQRLKPLINRLFEAMVLRLIERGYTDTENYYLDGTKLEANANK